MDGPVSRDGKYRIISPVSIIQTKRVEPKTSRHRDAERLHGPLFLIIHTYDMFEVAKQRMEELRRRHDGKVRFKIIPPREEHDAFCRGDFTVEAIKPEGES